jgi:hypothetical protein
MDEFGELLGFFDHNNPQVAAGALSGFITHCKTEEHFQYVEKKSPGTIKILVRLILDKQPVPIDSTNLRLSRNCQCFPF